jgi:uncharacterized alkaline shock family protein YloU
MEGIDKSMSRPARPRTSESIAVEDLGKTYISDEVVSIIARIAADQVEGVYQIGESTLRGMLARLGRRGGVESEVGLKEAAIDIEVVVEYGYPIKEIAATLRRQIISGVEYMTGRKVVEVNVHVVDVHIPKTEKRAKRQLE